MAEEPFDAESFPYAVLVAFGNKLVAVNKLENQKLKQAIIVVPEKPIGSSFHDESLT